MRLGDRFLGILLGIVLGIAILLGFLFLGSEDTIDSASISGGTAQTQTQPVQTTPKQP